MNIQYFEELVFAVRSQTIICPCPHLWDHFFGLFLEKLEGKVTRIDAILKGTRLAEPERVSYGLEFLEDPHVLTHWSHGNDYDKNRCFLRQLETVINYHLQAEVLEMILEYVKENRVNPNTMDNHRLEVREWYEEKISGDEIFFKNIFSSHHQSLWHRNTTGFVLDPNAQTDDEISDVQYEEKRLKRIDICGRVLSLLAKFEKTDINMDSLEKLECKIEKNSRKTYGTHWKNLVTS